MGGDISLESEYGKGSVFTAIIPQGIEKDTPFAAVEEPEKKKVLVYEGRMTYAKSVCWTLENLKVPYVLVTNQDDFASALYREEWFYVFSSYGLYEKIEPFMGKDAEAFSEGQKPPLALMIEWGTEAYISGARFISIPAQSLSIANVLNGRADNKGYIKSSGIIRFTFPGARILVVDDISTNLKVVEGLLAPYRVVVDTCLNGLQAIELVKRGEYDIVFMDHMMPEMDGIEATAVIRELEKRNEELGIRKKQVPIIALTANAVLGMREMFIKNGFNDFLSKPIDVSKLDEMLDRWIPREKRAVNNEQLTINKEQLPDKKPYSSLLSIPGVDTAKGIAMTGGTVDAYTQVLSLFCKDAQDRLPLLQKEPSADTMKTFVTNVHALKSASASIGAQSISSQAAGLEAAGKSGDAAFIRKNLHRFVEQLTELVRNIEEALETKEPKKQEPLDSHSSFLIPNSSLFEGLAEALKSQKISEIKRILNTLDQQAQDPKLKEILEQISDQVLMTEFDNALQIVERLINAKD
jgi:CheY-like chemotaxis protein